MHIFTSIEWLIIGWLSHLLLTFIEWLTYAYTSGYAKPVCALNVNLLNERERRCLRASSSQLSTSVPCSQFFPCGNPPFLVPLELANFFTTSDQVNKRDFDFVNCNALIFLAICSYILTLLVLSGGDYVTRGQFFY